MCNFERNFSGHDCVYYYLFSYVMSVIRCFYWGGKYIGKQINNFYRIYHFKNITKYMNIYININVSSYSTGLWAVVNSATWASFGEVEWVPFDVYKQSTDVNLLSVIRITQVFLPLVRRTKG